MSLLDSQGRTQNYGRINNNLYSSTTPLTESRSSFSRSKCVFVGALIIITIAVIIGGVVFGLRHRKKIGRTPNTSQPPPSILGEYSSMAVVSDADPCAAIGMKMLKENGTVIDAAVAALFCMGVYNGQSMGIGGGFLMTIFNGTTKKAEVLDAREVAPLASSENMFEGNEKLSSSGGMSVAVPGELLGYWEVHKKYGKLPWAYLIEPSVKLCEDGFPAGMHLARTLQLQRTNISKESTLREVFIDPETNDIKKQGDKVKRIQLGKTLKMIAEEGVQAFYNGSIGELFVKDVAEYGGIITMDDLRNYTVKFKKPVEITLNNGLKLYSIPPPGSGAILAYILKILDGYNFDNSSLLDVEKSVLTYHRIAEAMKFGYGKRSQLGDEDFVDMTELVKTLTSPQFAEETRQQIKDNQTFNNFKHYGGHFTKDDKGTAHLNVLGANGDAVSVTSTVNYWFGAGFRSKSTGIIPNNEMNDFSSPHITNMFGIPPSPENFIKPGKRPLSSMCPTIIVNANDEPVLVIGGAGGSKITSAVSLVTLKTLRMGQNIKQAIDGKRIHHQLFPMTLTYEPEFSKKILDGLKKFGHTVEATDSFGSVIVGIHQPKKGKIQTNYDFRKGGSSAGA